MKLDKVDYPYSDLYQTGYLYKNRKDGRSMVVLIGSAGRLTTAYARYLMAVKLGRFLTAEETVDHIDENHSNDSLENLQLLTLADNIKKSPHKKKNEHGTNAMYARGCRCELCVAYSRNRQRAFRAANPDKIKQYKENAKHRCSIEKTCEYCGSIFMVHTYEQKRRFCSNSCATRARFHMAQ